MAEHGSTHPNFIPSGGRGKNIVKCPEDDTYKEPPQESGCKNCEHLETDVLPGPLDEPAGVICRKAKKVSPDEIQKRIQTLRKKLSE